MFHPLWLGEERENEKDCFKLAQTLERKIVYDIISETQLQQSRSSKATINILRTKLLLKIEIHDEIPSYSELNGTDFSISLSGNRTCLVIGNTGILPGLL